MILSWGKDVEVIEPKSLRNDIKKLLEDNLRSYEK
jgi:predicted DNA-binding transcriptional regulator YafY